MVHHMKALLYGVSVVKANIETWDIETVNLEACISGFHDKLR